MYISPWLGMMHLKRSHPVANVCAERGLWLPDRRRALRRLPRRRPAGRGQPPSHTVDFRNFIVFFGPRPWHIEIRHRVKKTSTINLF